MTNGQCGNCRHFKRQDNYRGGHCLRFPLQGFYVTNANGDSQWLNEWPYVDEDETCGEWTMQPRAYEEAKQPAPDVVEIMARAFTAAYGIDPDLDSIISMQPVTTMPAWKKNVRGIEQAIAALTASGYGIKQENGKCQDQ